MHKKIKPWFFGLTVPFSEKFPEFWLSPRKFFHRNFSRTPFGQAHPPIPKYTTRRRAQYVCNTSSPILEQRRFYLQDICEQGSARERKRKTRRRRLNTACSQLAWVRFFCERRTPLTGESTASSRILVLIELAAGIQSAQLLLFLDGLRCPRDEFSLIRELLIDGRESRWLSDALLSVATQKLNRNSAQFEGWKNLNHAREFPLVLSNLARKTLKIFQFWTGKRRELPGWSCQ